MYICVTHIDSMTGVLCTEAPMSTGPTFPKVSGLILQWADKTNWPVAMDSNGVYMTAPKYYGVCDDDADTDLVGVCGTMTEAEFTQLKRDEFYARQPYDSWLFDEDTFLWNAPVAYPEDGKDYIWNEETTSWVERESDSPQGG